MEYFLVKVGDLVVSHNSRLEYFYSNGCKIQNGTIGIVLHIPTSPNRFYEIYIAGRLCLFAEYELKMI